MTIPKYTIGQPTTFLIAHQDGTKDSKGNAVTIRSVVTFQPTHGYGPNSIGLVGEEAITAATGEITVADNDFSTGNVLITLGDYTIKSRESFLVGGSATLTAVSIAEAVTKLPGYSATNIGAVVSVIGPKGEFGGNTTFKVLHEGSVENVTLSPILGKLTAGTPLLGPISIS